MRMFITRVRSLPWISIVVVVLLSGAAAARQAVHEAPAGVVVGPDNAPVAGASLYVYQTDHEGYYSVKPASDNRNPRLKLFLRTDAKGAYSFDTIKPGSYPQSRVPAHIHFEVSAAGRAPHIFEIVFTGDPFITSEMRGNPAFSERRIEDGKVTQRIVLK
jgi:protocatechuate 3,4-dioxygenase beta subunit